MRASPTAVMSPHQWEQLHRRIFMISSTFDPSPRQSQVPGPLVFGWSTADVQPPTPDSRAAPHPRGLSDGSQWLSAPRSHHLLAWISTLDTTSAGREAFAADAGYIVGGEGLHCKEVARVLQMRLFWTLSRATRPSIAAVPVTPATASACHHLHAGESADWSH